MTEHKNKRPLSVTLLSLSVLSFAVIHLVRFGTTLAEWTFLASLPLTVSPIYLAATGLIWGVVGLVLYPGLWFGKRWAKNTVFFAALVYGLYYWLEQLFIMDSPLRNSNWPFQIILSIVLLALTAWMIRRPETRTYFGETHE
jgi:uncharacterized membrane protein (DUF2068 family)